MVCRLTEGEFDWYDGFFERFITCPLKEVNNRAELKPCPFCGNSKTVYCENDGSGFVIEVVCAMCGARGPQFNRRGGAIEAWNKRS